MPTSIKRGTKMKRFAVVLFFLFFIIPSWVFGDTIMDQSLITPVATDQIWMVDDPGGTPADGRATVQSVMDLVFTQIGAAYDTAAELEALFGAKLTITDIDDTPVDSETAAPISSNWAYDHENAANPHAVYLTGAELTTTLGAAYDTAAELEALFSGKQDAHAYLTDIAGITANQGDIIYFDGTDWVDLGPGIDGYFLKTQGAAANPVWAAPPGGGDITAVGDCANGDCFVDGSTAMSLIFEGTDNAYETTLTAVDPTADATVTIPNATGTVMLGPAGLGTDNILVKTNGTGNIVQATGISIDDSNNMTSVATITTTGNITSGDSFIIGSADIEEAELEILDGATLSTTDINIIDGIGDSGDLTAAELLYVDGVTSAIQTQLDARCLESVFGDAIEADDFVLSTTTLSLVAEIPHIDAVQNISADWEWQDGIPISFGNDNDWEVAYDETTDDRLEFVHTAGAGADVYWDLNDNAEDSTFTITNSNATYEADLAVEGNISAKTFSSTASDGDRYSSLPDNTSGNQPTTADVNTGLYSYETDLYVVVNDDIHTRFDADTGDIYLYGATGDNAHQYQIDVTDPTADRVITLDDNNVNFGHTTEDYVLKYNASTRTWAGEADSTGSALGSNLSSSTNNIASDNDQISLEGTSEDIDLDFSNNTVTVTTDSGVSLFDFGALGIGGASLDLSEGNITNVGSIQIDSIVADGTNVIFGSAASTQLQFRDTSIYVASLDDGHLDLEADTSIDFNAPVVLGGAVSGGNYDLGSTSSELGDVYIGDGDGVYFGADQDVSLVHVADTGLLLNAAMQLQFRDSAIYINSGADGYLDLEADTGIRFNGPVTFVNEGDIDLPDNSVDAADIATFYAYANIPVAWMEDGTSAPDALDDTTRDPFAYRTFASDADEDLNFVWFVPADLSGSTIQFRVKYIITNATGPTADEGVAFGLSGVSVGDNDATNGAKGTVVVVTDDALNAAQHDILVTGWSGDVTITNLAAGELAECALIRDVSDAVDDYGQVVGVIAVEIRYVKNPA